MSKVKELQMNIQYIMNVLSSQGQQKASEAFENVLESLGYKQMSEGNVRVLCTNGMVDSEGNVLELGDTIDTVGQLRELMSELDDKDQVVVEACDEHGDVEDLYPMSLDIIEGIELTDGSNVREVRFCQRPNSEPDTREKQPVVDALIDVLAEDMAKGDTTVLDGLLLGLPYDIIKYALPEDMWADFEDKPNPNETAEDIMYG